jgi:peptide/nickel transport system permease protein
VRTYIIKRLIQSIGVCLVISIISFFLLFLNTDPALLLLPPEAEVKDIEIFKKQMGLDRPIIIQYANFLRKAIFHGDLGESFVSKIPALQSSLSSLSKQTGLNWFGTTITGKKVGQNSRR